MATNGAGAGVVVAAGTTTDDTDARQGMLVDGLVGIEEGRRFLSVSRSTLYGLMDSGQLAYVKFGRNRRIPRRALIAFAEAQLVTC
jgi:excisionase family DNA binding protein